MPVREPSATTAARLARLHGRYEQAEANRDGWLVAFCIELATLRDEEGLSVRGVAGALDISPSAVQKYTAYGRTKIAEGAQPPPITRRARRTAGS